MEFTVSNNGKRNAFSHINHPKKDDRTLCGKDSTYYMFAEENIYFEDGELYREDLNFPISEVGYCKKCLSIARKLDTKE